MADKPVKYQRDRKFYLAGPISGRPLFNAPAFEEAADSLREKWKLDVVSPLEKANNHHFLMNTPLGSLHYSEYIRAGLQFLAECTDIVLLPGWEHSKGAQLELSVAILCDMRVHTYREGGHLTRSTTIGNQDVI